MSIVLRLEEEKKEFAGTEQRVFRDIAELYREAGEVYFL